MTNPIRSVSAGLCALVAALGCWYLAQPGAASLLGSGVAVAVAVALLGATVLVFGLNRFSTAAGIVALVAALAFGVHQDITQVDGPHQRTTASSCVGAKAPAVVPGDLSNWINFGVGKAMPGANTLSVDLQPGDYRPNGWVLPHVGLCDYRLTLTVDTFTPDWTNVVTSDADLGWGYGIGVCADVRDSGAPFGASFQYGYTHGADGERVLLGVVIPPDFNTYRPFINDTPALVRPQHPPGRATEQSWAIDVHPSSATITGSIEGVPAVRHTWALTGSSALPEKCGPEGTDGIVLRGWGTQVDFHDPEITKIAPATP